MTQEEQVEFKQMSGEELTKIAGSYQINWAKFALYLEIELSHGNREFRIAFQDDKHFIVHPLGKNGETIDLWLD